MELVHVAAPPCVSRVLLGLWGRTRFDTCRPRLTPDFLLIFTRYLDFLCTLFMFILKCATELHFRICIRSVTSTPWWPSLIRSKPFSSRLASLAEEVLVRSIHNGTTFLEHLTSASAAQNDTDKLLFGSGARQGLSHGGHNLPGRKHDNATFV